MRVGPFTLKSREVAYPAPTKSFLLTNPNTAMLSVPFVCTHPPPPVPTFYSHTTYLPRTSLDMTL